MMRLLRFCWGRRRQLRGDFLRPQIEFGGWIEREFSCFPEAPAQSTIPALTKAVDFCLMSRVLSTLEPPGAHAMLCLCQLMLDPRQSVALERHGQALIQFSGTNLKERNAA
jgi:hypothetical protein